MIMEVIIVFVMSWWIFLFMALPIGTQTAKKVEPGHDDGAPEKTYLKAKLFWTTVITIIFTIIFTYIRESYRG